MQKSVAHIVLSKSVGFILFLILLGIANMLVPSINIKIYTSTIYFFNFNLMLMLILFLVGILNEIFWGLYFPFNIFAPVISSILSIYVVTFIYRLWNLIESYVYFGIAIPIVKIYTAVFLIVLVFGYILILSRGGKPKGSQNKDLDKWREERLIKRKEKLERKIEKINGNFRKDQEIKWKDVGGEFKLAFYNLGKSINRAFERKSKRKKKR